MKTNKQSAWALKESKVEISDEYIEILYGDITNEEKGYQVARIGKPHKNVFPIEWIDSESLNNNEKMHEECLKEISFYLLKSNEKDPWAYACYHCSTESNMYGMVHWVLHNVRTL